MTNLSEIVDPDDLHINSRDIANKVPHTADSAVCSRDEAIRVSRTFDWMILFTLFFVILGGYHIHYMLTGGDWDFWTDWKDRRIWVTVAPIVSITFPAAVQSMLWYKYRLPFGAVLCVLGLLLGEWVNRYLNFWGWTYFPVNFVFPSNLVPGAIVLDVILMLSNSMTLTAVVGGLAWGLLFYPGNWPIIAPLHVPVEYNGMMMTLADLQGYHYVRTGTPEYIRMVEKGTLRTFGKDVAPVSAFFSGFVSILIYFLWHFFGKWFGSTAFVETNAEKTAAKKTTTEATKAEADAEKAAKISNLMRWLKHAISIPDETGNGLIALWIMPVLLVLFSYLLSSSASLIALPAYLASILFGGWVSLSFIAVWAKNATSSIMKLAYIISGVGLYMEVLLICFWYARKVI